MAQFRVYRTVNILVALTGLMACMGSGVVIDRTGILGDSGTSLVQTMDPVRVIVMFVLPSLLALIATFLVIIGKTKATTLLYALVSSGLFVYMDWSYIASRQACMGILMNMLGIVALVTGVLLQCFGTPAAVASISNERRKKDEDSDAVMVPSGRFFSAGRAGNEDDGSAAYEAYYAIGGEDDDAPDPDFADTLAASSEKIEEKESGRSSVPWITDDELEELLRNAGGRS